MAPELSGLRP